MACQVKWSFSHDLPDSKDEQWAEVESEPVMCDRQRYAKQAEGLLYAVGDR